MLVLCDAELPSRRLLTKKGGGEVVCGESPRYLHGLPVRFLLGVLGGFPTWKGLHCPALMAGLWCPVLLTQLLHVRPNAPSMVD